MRATLYPVLDLDTATPDELRRHARDLHHRLSDIVKRLESALSDNRQLEADLREAKGQHNSLLGVHK